MLARAVAAVLLIAALCAPLTARASWPEGGIRAGQAGIQVGSIRLWADGSERIGVKWVETSTGGSTTSARTFTTSGTALYSGGYLAVTEDQAPDELGGIYSVWRASGNIYSQRVLPTGGYAPGPYYTGQWTVAATASSEMLPSVIGDGGGGSFIAWMVGSSTRLRRMQSDGTSSAGWPDAGVVIGAPTVMNTRFVHDGSDGVYALIANLDRTRVVRISGSGALEAGWPAGGVAVSSILQEGGTPAVFELLPSLGTGVLAAWSETPSGQPRRVLLHRVRSDGTLDPSWPATGVVVATTTGVVRIAPDGLGGALIAWHDPAPHLLRVLADGTIAPGFSPGGVNPCDAGGAVASGYELAVATGPNGGAIVAWFDSRGGPASVRVRWIQGDGTPDPQEPEVARVVASSIYGTLGTPLIVSDGGMRAWVAYGKIYNEESYTYKALYLAQVEAIPTVDVPPGSGGKDLALSPPWPNPARDEFSVRFTLDRGTAAGLELFDVSGRLVRWRTVSGAGEHLERFDRLGALDPGLYFLRLSLDGETRVARVVLAQ